MTIPNNAHFLVYVTYDSLDAARKTAEIIVSERLAACGNILPQMTSVYEWEGQIQESNECVMLLKTSAATLKACMDRIEELHTYDTPCVLSFEISQGSAPFLSWIDQMTGGD